MLDVKIVNTITLSAASTLEQITGQKPKVSKPTLAKEITRNNGCIVSVGMTGALKGAIHFAYTKDTALYVASAMARMYGMEGVSDIDDMTFSMLQEIGNQVSGSISTGLASIQYQTDITPPTIVEGTIKVHAKEVMLVLPFVFGDVVMELAMMLKV